VFVLFVVVFGLRCATMCGAVWGFLCLVFTLFVCCFGCGVVFARHTSCAD
jgi:hypothetical protein